MAFINVSILCIGFNDFKLKCENLLEYNNCFSRNAYEKNDKILLKNVQ